jgi:Ran GTPase-activating protein (RanGAP) involved in mRNA processing and transport
MPGNPLRNRSPFFDLCGTAFGDEGIFTVLKVLFQNDTITDIDVSENQFPEKCADLLEAVLKENRVLYSVNLSQNAVGDVGAEAISHALVINESLNSLSLSSCRITDRGANAIGKNLCLNHFLREFRLRHNFLTRKCSYAILEAVRCNESLSVLDLTATQIDHFVIQSTNDLCKRNHQIQKEISLQPLKKQLIQLSIQRMKIPEAESRLKVLEAKREIIEK